MTPTIWDSFSSDYRENCLSWQHPDRPLLPPGGPDWRSRWTANPDILDVDGRRLVYFRGNGTLANDEHLHDRLGVAELVADTDTDGVLGLRHLAGDRPVVDVGAPGSFDDQHVLDPAAVQFGGRIFLYYSAVGTGPDSIGLAVSDDGERFDKVGRVLPGRAPEVVERDGLLHLFFQVQRGEGYELHVVTSSDGFDFGPLDTAEPAVFAPSAGSWDAQSIITARISRDGDAYLMAYAGSPDSLDEPEYVGLARSTDLRTWERHPGNPVFGRGPVGAVDGGAIWFPALVPTENGLAMLYEGSRGRYAWDLSSQLCLATKPRPDVAAPPLIGSVSTS